MLKINTAYPSPNFNERPAPGIIDFLIIHYTECDLETSLKILCDAKSSHPVSAHYLIDEPGVIYRLVEDEKRAWHAGVSSWEGKEGLNDRSLGIELVNLGTHPFAEPQMQSLIALSRHLIQKYKIPSSHILGHQDIAPSRKRDPGPYFDWKRLAEAGVGLYPQTNQGEIHAEPSLAELQKLLHEYGYKVPLHGTWDQETQEVIEAFQAHFCSGSKITKKVLSLLKEMISLKKPRSL